jgi:uncharacterized protein (TIGR00255 family)
MAIYSMTGFGQGEAANDDWTLTVEIKSVNHRFKDIKFKMSSMLSSLEMEFRNLLKEKFKRGSFDISIHYKRAEKKTKFDDIDPAKVSSFLNIMKPMLTESGFETNMRPADFLRSEFYKDADKSSSEKMLELAKEAFVKALDGLAESRSIEGAKLLKILEKHQSTYRDYYTDIAKEADTFQKNVEEKLKKRFSEYSAEMNVDEPRFLQEVVYYLEKLDVHEEINRIETHLSKLTSLLNEGGEVGRQIDFLMQELNRETNTIGSKSNMSEISERVVQMKVQLEKIREQGLNIE